MNTKLISIAALSGALLLVVSIFTYRSIRQDVAGVSDAIRPVKAIVIPHHDLASALIQNALQKLQVEKAYKTIVVIGPNHYHPDSAMITTSTEATGYEINEDLVGRLTSEISRTEVNTEVIEKEHAMMLSFFYLSEMYPEATFVPVVLSTQYSEEKLEKLSNYLTNINSDDTLYVAAVDFSHESMLDDGLLKNAESISSISSFEYDTILRYEDDHLDSPVSIATVMKVMQRLGTTEWETWHSSHGALLLQDPSLRGTSYVLGAFR